MKPRIITIDGPAGSGKSTTARHVAKQLGYTYIDTGAMYRAVTVAVIEHNISTDDDIFALLPTLNISLEYSNGKQRTLLNGTDVSKRIRDIDVTARVSSISSLQPVRERLVQLQQAMGINGNIVMDGRDIGTVVFPDADLKIFMTADIYSRAERRLAELDTDEFSIDDIARQLAKRDEFDSTREASPLVKAVDAVEINTSSMTIDDQVRAIIAMC